LAKKGSSSGNRLRAKYAKYRNIMKKRAMEAQRKAAGGPARPGGQVRPPVEEELQIPLETEDEFEFSEDVSQEDLETPEGVCKWAVRTLTEMVQLPKAVIYLPNTDETLLQPRCGLGVGEAESIGFSPNDAASWVRERECRPFVLSKEKEDVGYNSAFPNSIGPLSSMDISVGIPFVSMQKLLGMIFFAGISMERPEGYEELYREDLTMISEVSQEIADSLGEIRERTRKAAVLGMWSDVPVDWKSEEPEEEEEDNFEEVIQSATSDQEVMQFLRNKLLGGGGAF
jgi:hypothetical protein